MEDLDLSGDYDPNDWQAEAHLDPTRHKALVGGLGSGKTSWALQEHLTSAFEDPGSVCVIGRELLPALRDSIWKDLMTLVPNEVIASYNKQSLTLILKNGSEFWGRPCYDAEIFKSYQISRFILEEANEVQKTIYDRLKDRLRQKLPNGKRPRYQSTILLNPTEDDHWIPQLFFEEKPPNHKLFTSTTFQNMKNLPPEYIDEIRATYSKEMQERLLWGKFGKVHKGRPVYNSFKDEMVRAVEFDRTLPLIRGWDFGFNHPACVFLQMSQGQVRVLGEVMGKRDYLEDFIDNKVLPQQRILFGDVPQCIDFCDPHGADQTDKGKTSVSILNDKFIFPVYRRTYIEEGIKAVKKCMDTIHITGTPNFLVHPRAKLIIEGLRGGYARMDGDESPAKDGYYDHLQDAMRYAVVFLMTRLKIESLNQAQSNMNVYVSPVTGRRIEQ